jgi:hypothetical protein
LQSLGICPGPAQASMPRWLRSTAGVPRWAALVDTDADSVIPTLNRLSSKGRRKIAWKAQPRR